MTEAEPAVILVTGASRGLGRGTAVELARAGYEVVIHYGSDATAAAATREACIEAGGTGRFPVIACDLAAAAARHGLVDEVLARTGRIDAVVHNAGIAPRRRIDVLEADEASFDEVVEVDLKAPHFLTRDIARHWLAASGPSRLEAGYKLVFIGSISATTVSPTRAEYCVAKAGLAVICELWAARLAGAGIQTIEIRPGLMETDMTEAVHDHYGAIIAGGDVVPQRRWGRPADVAKAVRAFIDGQLPFSTGACIHVDGGFHIRQL